ncbi:glycyl-radical enzyme activating protein [candidate division KSB1 bacterium]|nr:glycyl-radical enzyme activating protein [candidate division KSB1 bacterium]
MMNGLVFNIQRFSLHDGPGIRTTVFLKGCPLHCYWCHNPEGIRPSAELQVFPQKCIGCGECIRVCKQHAHQVIDNKKRFLRDRCIADAACVAVCYAGALELTGRRMNVDEVMAEIEQDQIYYDSSGGGVTLSGGEPLMQKAFSLQLLKRCREHSIHTALETCAFAPAESLKELLSYTDLVMMDIKHMDSDLHKKATGAGNRRILDNARLLANTDIPLWFRIPVIPEFNDSIKAITDITAFAGALQIERKKRHNPAEIRLELLSFHQMAGDKYKSLDMDYNARAIKPLSKTTMSELQDIVNHYFQD